jgi:hypothetical protein
VTSAAIAGEKSGSRLRHDRRYSRLQETAVNYQSRTSFSAGVAKLVGTFAAGVLAGAAAALLLTPKSGPGLREDLRHVVRRASESFKGAVASSPLNGANHVTSEQRS